MKLETLTNEELIQKYKEKYEIWQGYKNIQDGSYMMCYEYQVKPVVEELERRGIDPKEILKK